MAEISPLVPSSTAATKIREFYNKVQTRSHKIYLERDRERKALSNLEEMSELELRREIARHINKALGKLANGPVADGTGALGFGREWDYRKEFDRGIMLPLTCSYVRFTKAYEADEQSGVRLELLGLMRIGQMYVHLKPELDEKAKRVDQMTQEERKDFESLREAMESQKEAIEKDGLAPSDNRYYFIPIKEDEQPVVSTESDITRASRVNPGTADRLLGEELVGRARREDAGEIEPVTGLPRSREATLQDLRDMAVIVRGNMNFVKDFIESTPSENWGRPGLTE